MTNRPHRLSKCYVKQISLQITINGVRYTLISDKSHFSLATRFIVFLANCHRERSIEPILCIVQSTDRLHVSQTYDTIYEISVFCKYFFSTLIRLQIFSIIKRRFFCQFLYYFSLLFSSYVLCFGYKRIFNEHNDENYPE